MKKILVIIICNLFMVGAGMAQWQQSIDSYFDASVSMSNQRNSTYSTAYGDSDILTNDFGYEPVTMKGDAGPISATLTGTGDACNGSQSSIKLVITGGTTPFIINYTINGVAQPAVTGYTSGSDIILGILPVGVYNFEVTSVEDADAAFVPVAGLPAIYSIAVFPIPTITTTGTLNSLCFSNSPQITTLPYTATTQNPTSFSIDWNVAANSAGLADQGNTFYSFSPSGGTIGNINVSPIVPAGTYAGVLTISNGNGCTNTKAIVITINPLPTITSSGTLNPICFSPGPQNASMFYPATTNSPTSYSIDWNPAANLAGLADQSITAYAFVAGGGVINNIIISPGVPVGFYLGTLTIINANGCVNPYSVNLIVNPSPLIANMNSVICSDGFFTVTPVNLVNGIVPAGTFYSWPAPVVTGGITGGTARGGMPSITGTLTNPTNSPQTATYAVTPYLGGCTGPIFLVVVTVNPKPAIVSKTTTICSGSSFTVTPVNGSDGVIPPGTVYSWSSPVVTGGLTGGTAGFSSANISGTLSNPTSTTQTATYTVTPFSGSCTGTPFNVIVTVNPIGQVDDPADQVLCNGMMTLPLHFTTNNTGGNTTYTWTNSNPSIGIAASGMGDIPSFNAINPGTSPIVSVIIVTPNFDNGTVTCFGTNQTFTITVNPTGQVNDPANQFVCNGSPTTDVTFFTNNTGGITTYTWTNDNPSVGLAASGAGNIVSFSAVNSGVSPIVATITVTPILENGTVTCFGASKTFNITVNPSPVTSPITGQAIICETATNKVYETTFIAGSTYDWSIPPSLKYSFSSDLYFILVDAVPSMAAPGDKITVIETSITGCVGLRMELPVTVIPLPVPIISGPSSAASNSAGNVYTTEAGMSGYNWTISPGGTITAGSGTNSIIVTWNVSGPQNVSVTYTNTNSCSAINPTIYNVIVGSSLTGSITTQTNIACFGANSGSVTVAGSGGVSPYEYKLGTGSYQSSGTFSSLAAGVYTITVRDASLNTFDVLVTITEPQILNITTVTVNNLCFGGATGSAAATASGGTVPYNYIWNNGLTSSTITGLLAGTYSLVVSDASGCAASSDITITQPATVLSGSILSQTNVSTFGGNDGLISVAGSGGTSPYQYKLESGSYQSSGTFGTLSSGTYNITVQDANLCVSNIFAIITQPISQLVIISSDLVSTITSTTAICGGNISNDGGASITARGVCWSTSSNPTIADNITSEGTGTGAFTSSMTGLSAGTTYYVRAYATNSAGTAYGEEVQFQTTSYSDPSECLIYWYPLNGNADAEAGLGVDGTISGAVATEDRFGNANSAYSFNGVDNFITIPGTLPITNVFTISFWVYSDRASGYSNILTDGGINVNANDFLITFRGNNIGIRADKSGTSLNYEDYSPAELMNLNLVNRWVHVAWVMNPSGSGIYLDGVKIADINIPGTNEGYHDDHITIGARHVWTNMDHFFSGKLDDIRIYNCDLTESEIYNIFTEQGPLIPSVKTNAITDITGSTATSGGNILSDGGSAITARGICWNTSTNPTMADNKTMDGSGSGAFTSYLTGLVNGTTYYARTYATNSAGTAYGDELSFTPNTYVNCGTVTDIDGNTYNTVSIGSQCWMQENLKTTRYRNGDLIGTTTPATLDISAETAAKYQWAYNGSESNVENYGRLYTWYSVTDNRNVCPIGWHVPTDDEWTTLTNYLTNNNYGYGGSGIDIGKSLASTSDWTVDPAEGNVGNDQTSNNKSGFTAVPSGERIVSGTFVNVNKYSEFWSSSESAPNALYRYLVFDFNGVYSSGNSKLNGWSVRCLQGAGQQPPTITSIAVSSIASSSASCGGVISSDGGAAITARGVCWSTSPNPTIADSKTSDGTGTGTFTSSITGLAPGTVYYVRPYASNSAGTAYGYEVSFITLTPSSTLSGSGDACVGTSSSIRSGITGGTQPYTLTYTKNGVVQTAVTGYISGTDISLGVLDPGANIFEVTSIIDADSYSFPAGAIPPAYTINIYNIPDAGTTINNTPFICSNETTDIVFHSDIPNSDFVYTVTYSPATTWQSGKAPASGTQINGEGISLIQNLAHNSPFPVTVTYTITAQEPGASACPGPAIIVNVIVNPLGQVNQPVNQIVCNGSFVPAMPFTTNITGTTTYLWTNNNTSIGLTGWGFGVTEIPSFTAVNAGTTSVTASLVVTPIFINGGSCIGPTKTFTITVRPTPLLTSTLTPAPICSNSTFSYSPASSTAGTTFNWSRSAIAGISNFPATGAGNPNEILINTTVSPVSVRYVYTLTVGGCTNPTPYNVDVVVNPKPILVITNPLPVCSPATVDISASAVTSGSTSGLTLSYWTNAGATSSYATPATATAGTYYIKGAAATGCYDIKAVVVTVNPTPTVVITNPATICSPATADLTAAAVTTGSTAGLTYTYWTNAGATASYGTPTTASAGTYYIKGTTFAGCYDIKPVTVTVNPTPTVTITNPSALCSPLTADLTSAAVTAGSTAGLTYTYWTNAVATASYGTPTTASAGTYYIKGTTFAGCYDIKPVTVTVNPTPTVTITDPAALCSPATANLTAAAVTAGSTAGLTYTYWNDAAATLLNATPASAVAGTYYIKGTTVSGCFDIKAITVTVYPTPTLVITNPAGVCSPSTVNLTAAAVTAGSTAGMIYTYWTNAGATSSYATPVVATAGTYYIKGATATGCFDIKPVTVTVNPVPVLTSTLTPGSICSNSNFSYNPTSSTTGTTFDWTRSAVAGISNSASAGTGNPNESLINTTPAPVTVHYIYTLSANGCTNPSTYNVVVVVNPTPILSSTLTPAAICSNALFSYTPASATGGTIFNWARPAVAGISNSAASGVNNPNETIINTTTAPIVVSYNYTLIASGCSNVQNVTVTVNPTPTLSSTLTPPAICSNSVFNYSSMSVTAGTTFGWSRAAVSGISNSASTGSGSVSETLINTTTSPKVVTYVYTLAANGCTNIQNVIVTVNPIADVTTVSPAIVCSGAATNIVLNSNVSGATFNWTIGAITGGVSGATASGGSAINQVLTNSGATAGTLEYIVTPTAYSCVGNPISIVVVVNPIPNVTTASSTTICSGTSTSIALNSNVAGATFSWTIGTITGGVTGAASSSGPIINQVLTNSGTSPGTVTYIVTPTADFCQGNPVNIVVTVNPKPIASTISATNICSGTLTNVGLNSNVPGTSFTWTIGPITGAITGATSSGGPSINQALVNPGNTPGTVTYVVTPTANSCQGNPTNIVITVNPIATVSTVSPTTICSGSSTNIILASNVIGTTFNWNAGPITGGITGASPSTGPSINQVLTNPLMTPGSVTYLVTPIANACIGIPSGITVTVNPLTGAPLFTTGATTVCQNAPDEIYLATAINSTLITYSVLPLSAGVIDQFTGVMNWDAAFSGTATISATATGICSITTVDRIVTVNAATGIPVFTTGSIAVCQDSPDETYSASAANSTSLTYSVLPVSAGVIDALTGLMNWDAAFSGTATVTATAAGLCGTTNTDMQVMVNPAPMVVINEPSAVCSPAIVDLTLPAVTAGSTAGLTYTYWTDAGATSSFTTPASAVTGIYFIKGTTLSGCFDIRPVTVTVSPLPVAIAGGNQSICSDGTATVIGAVSLFGTLLWTTDGAGIISNETSLTPTYAAAAEDAGKTVILTMTVTSDNTCGQQTATAAYSIIVKEPQTIMFNPLDDKVYGDAPFTLTANASSSLGVVYTSSDNSVITISGTTATIVGAGNATIYANQSGDATYCAADEVNRAIRVTPKLITVTARPLQSKFFGEADPVLTYSVSPAMIGADVFTGALSRLAGEDIGVNYAISKGTLDAGPNYLIAFIPDNFTISIGAITIAVNTNQSKIYGDPDPVFAYTISPSSVNGENLTGALSRSSGEDIGTSYPIIQGTLSSDKYTITFIPADFSISPKPVTLSVASSQSKVYGEADPILACSVSPSLIGTDELSGSLSRDAGETVGSSYNITKGSIDAGPNYAITFVSSKFSITPKPIIVTAFPQQSKAYGSADPELGYTFYPEMIGLDGFIGSLTRSPGENVGSFYRISPGTLSAGANYTITFVSNNFSITPKLITLTVARGQSKVYGSADPIFTYSYAPDLLGNDVISGSLSRAGGENAGIYAIQLGTITLGLNYTVIFVPASFTINKSPLTVTADSNERHYLEPNPEFTLSFSGFVNGENKNVLDALPSASTAAISSSDAGKYGITLSGGSDNNYSYIYNYGVLTILRADQYIIFDEIRDKLRTSQTYELVAIASSGLPVSFESSDLKKAVISGSTMLVNKEGRNIITAKQEGNINWNPAPDVSNSYIGQPSFDNVTSLFTPNGDGVNDYWYIPDIEDFGSVQVKVYNRFGKLVYESLDYKNDWNGTFNGSPLPSASYYYIIKSSEKGVINGVVNIVR